MDTKQIISAAIGGVLVLAVGFVMLGIGQDGRDGRPGRDGQNGGVGAAPGPEVYNSTYFRAGAIDGGRVVSTTTTGAVTIPGKDLVSRSGEYTRQLVVTPTGASANVTLPATSTITNFIPNSGDCYVMKYENAATAATNTTIAAGTGMDLQEPDGQNVVIGQNNFANLEFCRKSNTDMVVTVDETIPAD
jgi:hypothetical protein